MNIFSALLIAITAACTAYSTWVKWQCGDTIDDIEDEIDKCAEIISAGGATSVAAQLRIERLNKRKQRKINSIGTL